METEQIGDFSTLFYNEKPKFRVTYDDNAIYFSVSCEGKPVPLEGVSLVLAPANVTIMGTLLKNHSLKAQS